LHSFSEWPTAARLAIALSDVARPLNYKTNTTYFFKTKTAFLKTIKLLTLDHWRSQKFWLRGAQIGNIFVTLFWWRFSVT